MRRFLYVIVLLAAVSITGCKKDKKTSTNTTDTGGTTSTGLDAVKDSIYMFAKEEYLWYDALPDINTFSPHQFTATNDVDALQKEVDAISQLKVNPSTGQPYEYYAPAPGEAKYSFIDDGAVSTELGGTNGDFGFAPKYNINDATDLRVKYVYPGSPADLAHIKRGYRITKINGRTALSDNNTDNVNFVVNAYYYSSTISMTLQRPDGSTFDVNLSTASYTSKPVLKDTTYDVGNGHKVGYLVFNTFTSLQNSQSALDNAFANFASSGVTDLVVDLRYNGGGYVETAQYIDNYIVPSAKSGSTMFTYYYNDKLQNDQYPLLAKKYQINPGDFKPQNNTVQFAKKGTLSVGRVFFIVTGSTASASELTINNLRPHVNVQLIGTTSYGKPVGFFAIDISKYQLYIPEFETKNSSGQGGYYAGMTPGTTDYPGKADYDDVTHDFGDPSEALLAHALQYAKAGTYATTKQQVQSLNVDALTIQRANAASAQLDKPLFKGMIFQKRNKR